MPSYLKWCAQNVNQKLTGCFLMNVKGQEKFHLIENQVTSVLL